MKRSELKQLIKETLLTEDKKTDLRIQIGNVISNFTRHLDPEEIKEILLDVADRYDENYTS